jgi:hypothetical protein
MNGTGHYGNMTQTVTTIAGQQQYHISVLNTSRDGNELIKNVKCSPNFKSKENVESAAEDDDNKSQLERYLTEWKQYDGIIDLQSQD